jgi:hypothetical protein
LTPIFSIDRGLIACEDDPEAASTALMRSGGSTGGLAPGRHSAPPPLCSKLPGTHGCGDCFGSPRNRRRPRPGELTSGGVRAAPPVPLRTTRRPEHAAAETHCPNGPLLHPERLSGYSRSRRRRRRRSCRCRSGRVKRLVARCSQPPSPLQLRPRRSWPWLRRRGGRPRLRNRFRGWRGLLQVAKGPVSRWSSAHSGWRARARWGPSEALGLGGGRNCRTACRRLPRARAATTAVGCGRPASCGRAWPLGNQLQPRGRIPCHAPLPPPPPPACTPPTPGRGQPGSRAAVGRGGAAPARVAAG